jgi:hypothetical protein
LKLDVRRLFIDTHRKYDILYIREFRMVGVLKSAMSRP